MSSKLALIKAQYYGLSLTLQHLMNTYWYLDHHQFEYAYNEIVKFAPCLDWKSDVVRAFHLHGYTDYAFKLFQMLKVNPETLSDLIFYSDVLLDSGDIRDAFEYYRNYASYDISHKLLHNILWRCFARHNSSYIQALMELPFTHQEAKLIRDFCIDSQEHLPHDFIILYQVHRGKYRKAADLYRMLNLKWTKRESSPFWELIMDILERILASRHSLNSAICPKILPKTRINCKEFVFNHYTCA